MKKTIAYIDGYNLYRGMTDKRNEIPLKKFLWLKMDDFILSYIAPNGCELVKIKYFTAPIKEDILRHERQDTYLRALTTIPCLSIYKGVFRKEIGGQFREKKTDVSMALHIYSDALSGNYEAITLLCGDTDQVPTLEFLRALERKPEIHLITPPHREPKELTKLADYCYQIRHGALKQHQFNNPLIGKGKKIIKPVKWS